MTYLVTYKLPDGGWRTDRVIADKMAVKDGALILSHGGGVVLAAKDWVRAELDPREDMVELWATPVEIIAVAAPTNGR